MSDAKRYKIVAKSPFEKKRDKLAKKEQRMSEKEEIARRKNDLRERQEKLKNQGRTQKQIQNDSAEERRREKLESERARNNRNLHNMTDDELRAVINRYKLEQEYRDIIKGPEKKTGAQIVANILIKSGQDALKEASKAYMTAALKKALGVQDSDKKNSNNSNNRNNSNNNQNRQNNQNRGNSSPNRNSDVIRTRDLFDQTAATAGNQRDRVEVYWRRRGRRS